MRDRIYNAFNEIKAEDKLKHDTYVLIQAKMNKRRTIVFNRFAVIFASFTLIFFVGLVFSNLYFTEIVFMDIDVNPGIELTLNKFNRVIGSYAYNDDGKNVLNSVSIKHKSYKDAIEIIINKMVEMDYISDVGLFTATLQTNGIRNEEELLNSVRVYIDLALQSQNKTVEQDIFVVDSDTKTHSHEQNLTPAKYLSILELQTVDSAITFDSCRNHSISEIKQKTHEHLNCGHENGNHGNSGSSQVQSSSHGNHKNR